MITLDRIGPTQMAQVYGNLKALYQGLEDWVLVSKS